MPTAVITDNSSGATYAGVEDSDLLEDIPTLNEGTNTVLNIWQPGGSRRRSCIRFTGLSNITGPVTVSSATLSIYSPTDESLGVFDGYRLLRAWTESGSSWNEYAASTSWTTAGGSSSGNDIASSTTFAGVAGSTGYMDISTAQLAADVQDMINNPSTNNGWVIWHVAGADTIAQFISSEGTDGQRPKLSVTYTTANQVGPIYYQRKVFFPV